MLRLAYFSPLPPVLTGVSDYSEELLPHLAKLAEVEAYVDEKGSRSAVAETVPLLSLRDFAGRRHRYDAVLYHLGNGVSHEWVYRAMERLPSFAVLHDCVLHHFVVEVTVGRGDLVGYMREMGYAYGPQGVAEARAAYVGRLYRYDRFPLVERVLDLNLGAIVHSHFARDTLLKLRPEARVGVVPPGVSPPAGIAKEEARAKLGLPDGAFVLGFLGFVTPNKGIETSLAVFASLAAQRRDSLFVLVGAVPDWFDVRSIGERLGLAERVRLVGYVPHEEVERYIAAADAFVSLRGATAGETSASVLRLMAGGKPVVVSALDAFAELPEGTCIKIVPGEGEETALRQALLSLAGDAQRRETLGAAARAYVMGHHTLAGAAQGYVDFIEKTLGECLGSREAS